MANIFKPNYAGFAELRSNAGISSVVEKAARQVKSSADGMGCASAIKTHTSGGSQGRVWASIYPVDIKARVKNSKTNALLKSLGSTKV